MKQWPWRTLNRVFRVTAFLKSNISKTMRFRDKVTKEYNRKPYTIYRMVPLSMTLSNLWSGFQGHDIFRSQIVIFKDKVTTAQEEIIPNNGMVLCLQCDRNWPLKTSRGFVSISWASCYIWPVWLEIAYLRPLWGSFGGYDGVPLGIGYRRKGSKN